jgi:hypothetical protein
MPKIKSEISMWFPYPDDPYGGKVHVRLPKPGEAQAIREKAREMKVQYVKEFRQSETIIRMNGAREGIVLAAVKDWENFLDESDKPLKCTAENVRIMCLEDGFLDFIDECLAELEKVDKEKSEAASKN